MSKLQSSNTLLLQSVKTLTQTINDSNLANVVCKLEKVSLKLNKATIPISNSNKITSYFGTKTQSTRPQPTPFKPTTEFFGQVINNQ